ncbi:tetratricopeptide repeat protein [Pseudodesulfovibrio sp. JC047]|uniref:tetratricopeptide repeat protein n=1 Tax=Pseudodesulfovibrio sp. JC047 TaxID=2683199 RepID=UPI0013CFB6EF|nr:tetratricopeptide repeat protein [Pseudodesulfovibrio sp. JC047]NDV20484.1 tetratricopeptide repeat protein [Pseudodesulfovibrio sp. JC047]
MKYTHRTTVLATMAAFALVALVGLSGCAPHKAPTPVDLPLSQSAQLNYDYLVYRDQMQRLQRHISEGKRSTLTAEEANQLHRTAVESLDRILAVEPSPELYLEKAGLFWNHPEGTSRSRATLKEGLTHFPNDRMLTIYLANSYIADGRQEDAINVMHEYLAVKPDDIQARERLGQMYMDAGQDAKALDMLKQIPEKNRTANTLSIMGRVQGNLGMRKAAIASLKKAIAMDPKFTEALVELAYQYELTKDYVSAEKIYTSILEQNGPFPEARLRLVNLNLKLNNPAKALQLTLEGPPSKSFILDAVLMFINNGFIAQGSTALDRLISGGTIPAEYYFYKAVIAGEGENDPDKALEYLDKVKETDRLYPHALQFKAQLFSIQGKQEQALELALKGKALYPDAPIFYVLESTLHRQNNDLDGAEQALTEGLARLKNDPELTYKLAMIYESTGKREQGLALMETVIRAHPDHSDALNYVGYTLAEENRELDRALVLVTKASSLDPENGYILDSVAWVHFKREEFDTAWKYIRYAVDVVDSDPTIWEHYGDIAAAAGHVKKARTGYSNALKLGHSNPSAIKKKLNTL